VVVGNEGAPPEMVAPPAGAPCGRIVDPRDPLEIAAARGQLLSDQGRARRLGEAARARAGELTPDRFAGAALAFYRALREMPPAVRRG
jgi:glycosyltransferase involved in cell wall biosynthesis